MTRRNFTFDLLSPLKEARNQREYSVGFDVKLLEVDRSYDSYEAQNLKRLSQCISQLRWHYASNVTYILSTIECDWNAPVAMILKAGDTDSI
jgi:hypothetical protein